jgi:hypothetical protein
MEITVFTLELQVKSIAWDHDDPETSPGEDGVHLVFPLTDAYGCCVLPAWDDEAFEPTRHTTLLCAHVVDKPRITHGEEPDHATFLVFDDMGGHFARVGIFQLDCNVEPERASAGRDTKGGLWDTWPRFLSNPRRPVGWLRYATRRTIRLG